MAAAAAKLRVCIRLTKKFPRLTLFAFRGQVIVEVINPPQQRRRIAPHHHLHQDAATTAAAPLIGFFCYCCSLDVTGCVRACA